MRRVVATLLVAATVASLVAAAIAPSVLGDAPVDIRGSWTGDYVTDIGVFPNTFTFTTEDFTTGQVTGTGNAGTYTIVGTVSGSSFTFVATQGTYQSTSVGTISADGATMTGTGTDTNGRKGTFSLKRVGGVDVLGTWAGTYDSSIGVFNDTFTFRAEDPTTGAVSGDGNGGSYVVAGTVTGSAIRFKATFGNYVADSTGTVSADGTTMSGTFTDTNGSTGTFTLTRTGGPSPSPSPSAAPSPSPSPAPSAGPGGAPGCTFGGSGGNLNPISTGAVDPSVVRLIPEAAGGQDLYPAAVAIDTGDPRGRVFVSHFLSRSISVVAGRPLTTGDIRVETSFQAGGSNVALAVDPSTGRLFVVDEANCEIDVFDGRAATPSLLRTIDLAANPTDAVVDPTTGRLFVALPDRDEVVMIDPDPSIAPATLTVPGSPRHLAIDTERGLVFVAGVATSTSGPPTGGTLEVFSARNSSPRVLAEIPAGAPSAIAVDTSNHVIYAAEAATGQLSSFYFGAGGAFTRISSVTIDADPSAGPVLAIGVLPGSHDVLVPLASVGRANLFTVDANGSLHPARAIVGIAGGVGVAVDPTTGRVFVAELRQRSVAVAALDAPVAPPPSLASALPGPLDISLAPQDIARSVGITAFLMLLLGAPTPLFNSTLSAKRPLIERWLRRRFPRRVRTAAPTVTLAQRIGALSKTWPGMIGYLLLVTLLYAFLDPGFPFRDAAVTFGTTLFGIAVGTAVSQLPEELYVRKHYRTGGQVKVVLWTLILAAGCVLVTRVTGVQPGYVYGIIGGFAFSVALTEADHGRMAFRGMSVLLGVGFAAWFLRIPFQPSVAIVGGDAGTIGNGLLADLFVSAVQGAAIGLIPLRFLTGETLFAWDRRRWAVLWGLSLILFAHVILYPVSSFEPSPSATGLWTVGLTVVIYGGIALGFWGFFARRDRRRGRRVHAIADPAAEAPVAPTGADTGDDGHHPEE